MTEREAIEAIKSNWPDSRYSILREALNMALDLFEKKEKGLIIELPVPIGSIIYSINFKNEIEEVEISRYFPIGTLMELMLVWGKEVFPTREEAEAKLKELRDEK